MERTDLKQILLDQQAQRLPDPCISRGILHAQHTALAGPSISIITGLRRSGKSILLQLIRLTHQPSHYWVNFDDDRLTAFTVADFQTLFEVLVELYGHEQIFFFDEIQNIPEWERFVRRLHDEGYKVYITGSNAALLSHELGTRLTGRYTEMTLYPFSFREFLNWKQISLTTPLNRLTSLERAKLKHHFTEFVMLGGIPGYLQYQDPEYLRSLYSSILYRDIIVRHKISNPRIVKEIGLILASSVGKSMSYNALRKTVNLSSPSTASDYCKYFQESFLFFIVNRFDTSLKRQIQYHKKIYAIDTALTCTIGFRTTDDTGRLLENIVYLELRRRGLEIYFHQQKKECDFVVRTNGTITAAIQVCTTLSQIETRTREIAGLVEAMQQYTLSDGLILTEDETAEETITIANITHTIHIKPIWVWLLEAEDVWNWMTPTRTV
ncbi:MAG: hypothetical protein A3J38_09525 [Gammaproteobacteria bacterium RIFCSPHIGHO2_12_FULL_45_9]|nr:MAG: hypothetical protein A3J38_09525 [Gammaproteobacteria bacterium RIFCSPHIGHO2_12_FULL_45_9]